MASMEDMDGLERISLWRCVRYVCMSITVRLVFYVLYKERMQQTARLHLIMSICYRW